MLAQRTEPVLYNGILRYEISHEQSGNGDREKLLKVIGYYLVHYLDPQRC